MDANSNTVCSLIMKRSIPPFNNEKRANILKILFASQLCAFYLTIYD